LAMASAGVQALRVHDVAETRQALALHLALASGAGNDTERPAGNGAGETGR